MFRGLRDNLPSRYPLGGIQIWHPRKNFDFLTPSPLSTFGSIHLEPPLLRPLFYDPLQALMGTSYLDSGSPLSSFEFDKLAGESPMFALNFLLKAHALSEIFYVKLLFDTCRRGRGQRGPLHGQVPDRGLREVAGRGAHGGGRVQV